MYAEGSINGTSQERYYSELMVCQDSKEKKKKRNNKRNVKRLLNVTRYSGLQKQREPSQKPTHSSTIIIKKCSLKRQWPTTGKTKTWAKNIARDPSWFRTSVCLHIDAKAPSRRNDPWMHRRYMASKPFSHIAHVPAGLFREQTRTNRKRSLKILYDKLWTYPFINTF